MKKVSENVRLAENGRVFEKVRVVENVSVGKNQHHCKTNKSGWKFKS